MDLLIFYYNSIIYSHQILKLKYPDFNAEIKYKSNNSRQGDIQKRHQQKTNTIRIN